MREKLQLKARLHLQFQSQYSGERPVAKLQLREQQAMSVQLPTSKVFHAEFVGMMKLLEGFGLAALHSPESLGGFLLSLWQEEHGLSGLLDNQRPQVSNTVVNQQKLSIKRRLYSWAEV
jgi:hypothetical protein